MRTVFALLIVAAALTGTALAQAQHPGMTMAMPSPPPSPAAAPSPAPSPALIVHIKDFAYVPDPAMVRVGDTIQFINDDQSAHTVTADDKSFDSGYMAKGDSWSYTFTKAGTIPIICIYHRFMRASIVVSAK
jgi:plastocyanin